MKSVSQSIPPSAVSHLGNLQKQIEKLNYILEIRNYDSTEGLDVILKSGGTIHEEIRKRKWIETYRDNLTIIKKIQTIFRNRTKKQKEHKWHSLGTLKASNNMQVSPTLSRSYQKC